MAARVLTVAALVSSQLAGLWILAAAETLRPPLAPPPAVTETRNVVPEPPRGGPRPAAGETLYSIGEPSDSEQLYLELVNRTRANPPAEAVRLHDTTDPRILFAYDYFKVDADVMVAAISAYPVAQPLAINAKLTDAARGHSQWMFDHQTQSHFQTDNNGNLLNDPGDRINATGYPWQTYGESVFVAAESEEHGHAAFEVDWGLYLKDAQGNLILDGEGQPIRIAPGMQDPPGHRDSNHNPSFREAGIGVLHGTNDSDPTKQAAGPQVVTIDFGAQQGPKPFVTGVAYFDLNGNNFYDLGEGIGGLTVNVSGSAYYAVTAGSGGYAVPSDNGARTVTFSGPNLNTTQNKTISGGLNVKADLILAYQPPVVTGPAVAGLNINNTYTFTPLAVASAHQWRARRREGVPVEGAEQGAGNVTATDIAGYNIVATDIKRSGTASFHLAHVIENNALPTPSIELPARQLKIDPNATWQFASRLTRATDKQVFRAQISRDDGATWENVYSQPGVGSTGESAFTVRTVPLAPYAGGSVGLRFRFLYDFLGGSLVPGALGGYGVYVDDISFTGVQTIIDAAPVDVPSGTSFAFKPTVAGSYTIDVRGRAGQRWFPWGTPLLVETGNVIPPTVVRITGIVLGTGGKVRVDFQVESGSPATFQLERITAIGGAWGPAPNAVLTNNGGGSYTFRADASGSQAFLRIKAQ